METEPRRAALYARVSSEKQDVDLSITAQLKALREYASKNGYTVVREFVEEAETGTNASRPAFREMISLVRTKAPPFDAILVWKLNRFARSRTDSVTYKTLIRSKGIDVVSINEPIDDSPAGRLLEGVIESIDEFYSANLSVDTMRGMKENAGRGFNNGGTPPFGYRMLKVDVGGAQRSKLVPENGEAIVVKRAFTMGLSGWGGKEIAKAFNKDGLRTRAGNLWSTTVINYMLRNEAYGGTLVWNARSTDVIRIPNAHPALVPKEDFDRMQRILNDRRPRVTHPRTVSSQYLLSPFLHCGKCGAPMIGVTAKSGRFSYYRCNNALRHAPEACSGGWLAKRKIESFVVDRLKGKVLTDENLRDLVRIVNEEISGLSRQRPERLSEIERQLESVNQKLLRYYLAFEKGTINDEDAGPRIRQLRVEQATLQREKDENEAHVRNHEPAELNAQQVVSYVRDLKGLLSEGSFMEQKSFLRSFIKRIDFEPGQVTIDYAIPMPMGKETASEREVLSINRLGSPTRIRT